MFMVTKANKSPKKTRKQRVKHITKTDTHFMVRRSLLVYAILVFVLFWLTAMSVYLVDRMVVEYTNTARYNQIHSIYSNLKLDESYRLAVYKSNISNDKSITTEYGHNTSVSKTRVDLTEKIKESGFSLINTKDKDTIIQSDTFKDTNGHILYLSVIPQALHKDYTYGTSEIAKPYTKMTTSEFDHDQTSYVTIKISLSN